MNAFSKPVYAVALVLLAAAGFSLAQRLRAPATQPSSVHAAALSPKQGGSALRPGRVLSTQQPERLTVALRLDPTLTQGMFMGDRWVAPADFFFAQPGTVFVVQAKAQHRDARGERHDFAGNWNATNPRMVNVQRDARTVTLEIRQPGDSDVTVSAAGETVVLHVHAVQLADSIQVHIRQ